MSLPRKKYGKKAFDREPAGRWIVYEIGAWRWFLPKINATKIRLPLLGHNQSCPIIVKLSYKSYQYGLLPAHEAACGNSPKEKPRASKSKLQKV